MLPIYILFLNIPVTFIYMLLKVLFLWVLDGRRTRWLDEEGRRSQVKKDEEGKRRRTKKSRGKCKYIDRWRGCLAYFLTMVEYRAYIHKGKTSCHHLHSRKSIRVYPGQRQVRSIWRLPFLPIHQFPARLLHRLPLRFLSGVPCPAFTGNVCESSNSIPSRCPSSPSWLIMSDKGN